MQITWKKLGRIFKNNAAYPTVELLDEYIRVYYSARTKENKSCIFYFDVLASNPKKIINECNVPLFDLGQLGSFDCDGHAPRCIVNTGSRKLLYIIGWNKKTLPPYQLSIGVAVWQDNQWQKCQGPVMDRAFDEPFFCTSPCVIYDGFYRMWYCSCTGWIENEPTYLIRYAESEDGLNWKRNNKICIGYDDFTKAIGWPVVWKEQEYYHMIYSYRGMGHYRYDPTTSYRFGYAKSKCGLEWIRLDEELKGLERSSHGWDSEMVAYAAICDKYLFYNGNGFGKTGIGLAVHDET